MCKKRSDLLLFTHIIVSVFTIINASFIVSLAETTNPDLISSTDSQTDEPGGSTEPNLISSSDYGTDEPGGSTEPELISSSDFQTTEPAESTDAVPTENSNLNARQIKLDASENSAVESTYFDITNAINTENFDEIETILKYTSHVYYSTDRMITDILSLGWMVSHLRKTLAQHSENSTMCLTIAFQMTNNRSEINWRHIEDVLSTKPFASNNLLEADYLQDMKKHLCGVVLDFQLENDMLFPIDYESFSYLKKWDLSFTKYARKTLKTIFGPTTSIPVGLVYNEQQLDYRNWQIRDDSVFEILRQQEIQFADFIIVNVGFSVFARMPYKYEHFRERFNKIAARNQHFLKKDVSEESDTMIILDENVIPITYMATWEMPFSQRFMKSYFSPDFWTFKRVWNSSRAAYLSLFEEFVGKSVLRNDVDIRVISGAHFDLKGEPTPDEYDGEGKKVDLIVPYLYTHDVDVTPCQLRTMLDKIAKPFDTLVVNEFTWSALARNEESLVDPENEKCAVSTRGPLKLPQNIMLFASEGIGQHWNKTNGSFMNLVESHISIAEMNLTTLVFSPDDVRYHDAPTYMINSSSYMTTTPGYYQHPSFSHGIGRETGIKKFVKSWVDANMSSIGCLIDMPTSRVYDPYSIFYTVSTTCGQITRNISVFVWQYSVNLTSELGYEFSYEFGWGSVRKDLFNMLGVREILKDTFPDAEVIINIVANDAIQQNEKKCSPSIHQQVEFQVALMKWAEIHKIKIMFKPAFNIKNPMDAIWIPPHQDGSENLSDKPFWMC